MNVNEIGGEYGTALNAATFNGDHIAVVRLLSAGADVNLIGGRYGTALQSAILGHCDATSMVAW